MWHLLFRVPKRDLNFDNYPFLTIFGIHSKFLNKNPVQGFQWAVRILSKAQGGLLEFHLPFRGGREW